MLDSVAERAWVLGEFLRSLNDGVGEFVISIWRWCSAFGLPQFP